MQNAATPVPPAPESHVRMAVALPAWPGLEFAVRLARAFGVSEAAIHRVVARNKDTKGADAWKSVTWAALFQGEENRP